MLKELGELTFSTVIIFGIASIPDIAKLSNPLYAVAIAVSGFALDTILDNRPPLTGIRDSTYHRNNMFLQSAIITGVTIAVLGVSGAAFALFAFNIGALVASRVTPLVFDGI